MKRTHRIAVSLLACCIAAVGLLQAGPLDPPAGPLTATYKTLHEVEPRIPINATNTPGDATSTYRISHSGSYYLTSDITGASGKHGIKLDATDGGTVTIDFRGHHLTGVPNSLHGIVFNGAEAFGSVGTKLRAGIIRGWGGDGVHLPGKMSVTIEDMTIGTCAGDGVEADIGAHIVRCTISTNGAHGINAVGGMGTLIQDTGVADNTGTGIVLGELSVVRDCRVFDNLAGGIVSTGTNNEIAGCQVLRNSGAAYIAGVGDMARHNTFTVDGGTRPILVSLPGQTTFANNRLAITIGQVSAVCLDVSGSANSIHGNRFVGNNTFPGTWFPVRLVGSGNTLRANELSLSAPIGFVIQGASNVIADNALPAIPTGGLGIRVEATALGSTIEHNTLSGAGAGAYTAIQLLSGNNLCIRNDLSRINGGSAIDNQGAQNAVGPSITPAQMAANTNPAANFVH